jgi:hypothetical protein
VAGVLDPGYRLRVNVNICKNFPMTTVLVLANSLRRMRVGGILQRAVLIGLLSGLTAAAQDRPVHWLNAGAMPPGAIGSQRLARGGPLSGYFQPVRIRAPEGARIALASEGGYSAAQPASAAQANESLVGLQLGYVYRLRVTNIPDNPGVEIYPSIELLDRLYPPPGLALRFPIPIELTKEELQLAADGAFVTRVIYVEDPLHALPVARRAKDEQPWREAPAGEDPLVTADREGRPVAILRIGSRDTRQGGPSAAAFDTPPVAMFDPAAGKCPDAKQAK